MSAGSSATAKGASSTASIDLPNEGSASSESAAGGKVCGLRDERAGWGTACLAARSASAAPGGLSGPGGRAGGHHTCIGKEASHLILARSAADSAATSGGAARSRWFAKALPDCVKEAL